MPAAKTLHDHVVDGTFRSRRHRGLLAGPAVPWPDLASIQGRYAAAAGEPERRVIGVVFERAVCALQEASGGPVDEAFSRAFDAILAMGPVRVDRDRDRRASERFARALQVEWRRDLGWTFARIAESLSVTPAGASRDLAYLARWKATQAAL